MEFLVWFIFCGVAIFSHEVFMLPRPFGVSTDMVNSEKQAQRRKRSIDDVSLQNRSPLDRAVCQLGAITPNTQVNSTKRLKKLRDQFSEEKINAYSIIEWRDIVYISGFTGEYGFAVVFDDRAAIWVDPRYYEQVERQVDCNWIVNKLYMDGEPTLEEYVIAVMKTYTNKVLGADPFKESSSNWQSQNETLIEGGVSLKEVYNRLLRSWSVESTTINALSTKFAGKTWQEKLLDVYGALAAVGADALVLTAFDDIAWLFNLRASDFNGFPGFYSRAMVDRTQFITRLYIHDHQRKLNEHPTDNMTSVTVAEHLNTGLNGTCVDEFQLCVEVKENNLTEFIHDIDDIVTRSSKVWVDSNVNQGIYSRITPSDKVYQAVTPVAVMKATKNKVERMGMKNAHLKDSVAIIKFAAHLEKEVQEGKVHTELSAAKLILQYRRQQQYNRGYSFTSISASGPNSAVIHYAPTRASNRNITTNEMYLIDSGGQYLDGTTDITRTFHFGEPTNFQKEVYTRVLMGQIDLTTTVWPIFMYGRHLDMIARRPLSKVGLLYMHGTGHGIGSYLRIHEGPGSISPDTRSFDGDIIFDEGQFYSIEPGYYESGEFGIRLENIVMVKRAENLKYSGQHFQLCEFETINLIPYEPHLLKYELLTDDQIDWLNKYNKQVLETVGPLVKDDTRAYQWLLKRVRKVDRHGPEIFNPKCFGKNKRYFG